MSWTDEEIDKMFQDGAEGLQFEYKESYWKEMEAMLPKGGSKGDFLWFFTAFLFLGLFGVMTTLNMSKIDSAISQTTLAQFENTLDVNSKIELNNEESQKYQVKDDVDQILNSKQSDLGNESFVNSSLNSRVKSTNRSEGLVDNLMNSVNSNASINGGTITTEEHLQTEIMPVEDLEVIPENNEFVDNQRSMNEVPTLASNEHLIGNVDQLNYLEMKLLEENERVLASYPNYPTKVSTISSMYAQAIGGASQSYISPSAALSYSYGIGAGVQLQNKAWKYNFGLNAIVSNHNDLSLNRTAKVYGFGSDVYNYHLNYQQIYLVEGNFSVSYSFGKHDISVGIRPSYTFSSKVKMTEELFGNSMSDLKESKSRNVYGFMDGLKSIGVKPHIGYSYSITPGLHLGINLGVQLMPMINEEFLVGYTNRLPVDGQIYLRKTIDFK